MTFVPKPLDRTSALEAVVNTTNINFALLQVEIKNLLTIVKASSNKGTGSPTHTGEVTGNTALSLAIAAITNKTTGTPVDGDYVLFSDTSNSGVLRKANAGDFLGGGGAGSGALFDCGNRITGDTSLDCGSRV